MRDAPPDEPPRVLPVLPVARHPEVDVTSPQKRKGDRAELELVQLLDDLTGYRARRTRPGRAEDEGDLHLEADDLPLTVVQVAAWRDVAAAVRIKPLEAEEQRTRAGAAYAVTALKLPRAGWRFVLTPEQYAAYLGATIETPR